MKKLAIVLGRFQPVHKGHMDTVLIPAYDGADHVLVLLGSANRAPSPKNPFSPDTRAELISEAYRSYGRSVRENTGIPKVQFRPLFDFSHNLNMWLEEVQYHVTKYQTALAEAYEEPVEVVFYGVKKDGSSFYVDLFPQWELVLGEPNQVDLYSASHVRRSLYMGDDTYQSLVPSNVAQMLTRWRDDEKADPDQMGTYAWCARENAFYDSYGIPYREFSRTVGHGYIGNTVDGIVFNRGRVLLVKRGRNPGKGLWALPGGYVNEDETFFDACLREVREETKFKLNRGWLKAERLYDNPGRSLKGRVVTYGYGFSVPATVDDDPITHSQRILGIEGGSDTKLAKWVPMSDLRQKEEFVRGMFEDHGDIIADMYNRIEGN